VGLGGSVGAFPAFTIRRVLQANLHDDQRIDDVARRAGGEREGSALMLAESCFHISAMLRRCAACGPAWFGGSLSA